MKIVFLTPASQQGGAEVVLFDLLGALREARPGWSLHVLAGEDGPLLDGIQAMNIPCEVLAFPDAVRSFGESRRLHSSPDVASAWHRAFTKGIRTAGWLKAGLAALGYVWKLRRRLRQLRPDLLHSNGMKMHLLAALAKPKCSALVWHLHDYLGTRPAMKPLLRRLASRCTMVVANSHSVARDARAALPASLPVDTVYNAVTVDTFTPNGPALDLDHLAGLPPAKSGTIRIGLVATFAFWKGHEIFLHAAAAVVGNYRFYVIGGPVYATAGSQRSMEELHALAAKLGLEERVGFTGLVADVPAAMRGLDVVVHASTEPEPFGLVIVQAMACARAVVVSGAGGALELVEPEIDALVHTPGDIKGLAAAIGRLASDAGLRERLGRAGCAKVRKDFSVTRMAQTITPFYVNAASVIRR